jgi:hypothetical protein
MVQKSMYGIVAIVAVLFFGALSMGDDVVRADDGYYTHVGSHIVFVDSGNCPCGDAPGQGYACNNCNSFTQQPHVQMVALTDNCFWSYPVQCN